MAAQTRLPLFPPLILSLPAGWVLLSFAAVAVAVAASSCGIVASTRRTSGSSGSNIGSKSKQFLSVPHSLPPLLHWLLFGIIFSFCASFTQARNQNQQMRLATFDLSSLCCCCCCDYYCYFCIFNLTSICVDFSLKPELIAWSKGGTVGRGGEGTLLMVLWRVYDPTKAKQSFALSVVSRLATRLFRMQIALNSFLSLSRSLSVVSVAKRRMSRPLVRLLIGLPICTVGQTNKRNTN